MIVWGKIIAGLFGLMLYGPAGMILGIVFGHIFDKGMYNLLHIPRHAANTRLVFFRTVFQTMGYLAKADGVVSEREIQVARDVMLNYFSLDKRQMLLAIQFFNEGKAPNFNINAALQNFSKVCGKYGDLRRFFLEIVVKASLADNVLREPQREKLIYICNALRIQVSELNYQLHIYGYSTAQSRTQHTTNRGYNSYSGQSQQSVLDPQLMAAYNLLGVKPADNIKTIKGAYRRLMSKYHPDKLVAKGLPPEMLDMAKEKTQQVAAAYALIMRSKR